MHFFTKVRWLLSIVMMVVWGIDATAAKMFDIFDIRDVSNEDLEDIMKIDQEVSFEFFLPLYPRIFEGSWMGKNPEEALTNELMTDYENFKKAIDGHKDNNYLIAAFDRESNKPVGLLWFDKASEDEIEIKLLLVIMECRGKGVGEQLFIKAIDYLGTTKQCFAEVYRDYNERPKKFYTRMGFVNQGPTPRKAILPGDVSADKVLDRWVYTVNRGQKNEHKGC